jgi:hypothetical protein
LNEFFFFFFFTTATGTDNLTLSVSLLVLVVLVLYILSVSGVRTVCVMVFKRHFQQYFSYILTISFIGGGNRRKPPTLQTSSHKLVLSTPRRDGMRGIQIHNFNFSGDGH